MNRIKAVIEERGIKQKWLLENYNISEVWRHMKENVQ